jgi:EAL domain-containing protein (putative c-di-GMP-specific phosphodiesterase class I)
VVAEGVETVPELQAVWACSVDLAQGYLLARPSATPPWVFEGLPAGSGDQRTSDAH